MSTVKGSKQVQMVVVPHQPWRVIWIRAVCLVLALLIAAGAWFFGHLQGVDENGDARAERDLLIVETQGLMDRNVLLNNQITNLEQASSVDKEALNSVQQTIVSLRDQISQLEEDVLFYKQIMSPENQELGLVIGQLDLIAADERNVVRFRLELKQQGNNENLISGYANVNLLGVQAGQEVSVPLRNLSPEVVDLDIKLQFRYFQNIEGELELPQNFEPQKVQILAVADGENAKTVRKSFGWLVQD